MAADNRYSRHRDTLQLLSANLGPLRGQRFLAERRDGLAPHSHHAPPGLHDNDAWLTPPNLRALSFAPMLIAAFLQTLQALPLAVYRIRGCLRIVAAQSS